MKANLATSLIAYARGGVRKQLLVLCLLTLCAGNMWASAYLKGAWDSWVNHDISGGSCEITLDANTEYEFGIDVDGSFYSYTNQNFTTTSTSFQIYTGNGNCKITTGEAGTYIFKTWYDNGRYMAVYYPQARLTKQKYIYFDARNQTNWNSDNFDARFWFKYYDSGSDNGSVDCNKGNALENWVYYALVPDHDYIGQIQMNRLNPSDHDEVWCTANIAYAKDRTSSAQNCLKEESGKANYCIYWTPQWTTYCPPMTSVTLADNGTTNWGGNGSSGNPFLVPTGGDIKVHVTASASALDDANMTKYFLFKKEGSAVGEGSSSTEKTITASGTTNTKEAVTVDAYNYYNSTEGTHLTSSAIYYEARTPYTISYNAGTGGSGSRASETKLKGVNFTLPNSAVFERTGYTQTGWTTSNLGAQTHAFGASYSSDEAQTFYPVWSENEYNITINVAGSGTTSPVSSTIGKIETPSGDITATPGTGYSFSHWGFSKQGESDYDVWCAAGYTPTNATIRILAKRDGTLTAKFIANNYNVNLENLDADEGYKGTENVSVTYNSSDSLKKNITIPQKAHYDFGGYYTGYDEQKEDVTGVQLINEYGEWIASVEGYTDGDKNWLYADTLTLYAKWTEHPYKIALVVAPEGAGTIDKGDTITAYYVTPTDLITATANPAWKFKKWEYSENVGPANGTGNDNTVQINAARVGMLTANFEERYSIKGTMNGENWGTTHTLSNIGTNAGSKDTCYVTMTLPANKTYEFAIYDEQTKGWLRTSTTEVSKMTYGNSSAWPFDTDKTVNCGITTAGKGEYKFIFNITDKTVTVVYPTSYQVNYGAAVGGSVTSVLDDDGNVVPNGGYVRKGGSVTYEAIASDGYTFTGWCPNDSYGDTFTDINPWENSNVTATSNAYAKFHSTNFVIYRTGDKSSDLRAVWDDVESYEGGTISETIEFRMKVNKLDFWYTLCLPFEVNAVQVWEDSAYYDIVPYWRTEGKYYTGHYILRRPVTSTNFAIEGFEGKDRWIDPESSDVLPSKNIPYIIQWHDPYFFGKYISFFGDAGQTIQTIQTAMDKVSYPESDERVNIYGNNSMTTVTVRDAYMLDSDYGSGGAWLRAEVGTDRTVLPFECFILANEKTTAKYRVLRRDMADDTPTGLDTLSKTEDTVSKVLINNRIYIIRGGKMYTIQGTCVKEVE